MSERFNVNMTSRDARAAYWLACEGKSKAERELIRKEYVPIAKIISERELACDPLNRVMSS